MVNEKVNLKTIREKAKVSPKMVRVKVKVKMVKETVSLVRIAMEQVMKVEKTLLENHLMVLMVKTHQRMVSH
jgi:hypothetical protein